MPEKGGVSLPLVLVVTIIVVAIVIAFTFLFVFNTKEKLEKAFEDLVSGTAQFSCSLLGPVQGVLCPQST